MQDTLQTTPVSHAPAMRRLGLPGAGRAVCACDMPSPYDCELPFSAISRSYPLANKRWYFSVPWRRLYVTWDTSPS